MTTPTAETRAVKRVGNAIPEEGSTLVTMLVSGLILITLAMMGVMYFV